jgi:DNA repair protein RecO (recombination protein O)
MPDGRQLSPLTPAFILHSRPYRDTSVIAEFLTADAGRLSVVIRGARGSKPRHRGLLQPFVPALVAWAGRSELKSLRQIEFPSRPLTLTGEALITGMYINELLVRLVAKFEPVPKTFAAYALLMAQLEAGASEADLRRFEIGLLSELGYGLTLARELRTGAAIAPDRHYRLEDGEGFMPAQEGIPGAHLLAIAADDYEQTAVLISAREILRLALSHRLGDKPLHSRALMRRVRNVQKASG